MEKNVSQGPSVAIVIVTWNSEKDIADCLEPLLWRGSRAAVMAPDRFGTLLGIGIITGIIVQALFNISVVISILPAKGIPLPFISYGGSSVMVTLVGVGILLNISKFAGAAGDVRGRKRG